jgi:hypothetical protein
MRWDWRSERCTKPSTSVHKTLLQVTLQTSENRHSVFRDSAFVKQMFYEHQGRSSYPFSLENGLSRCALILVLRDSVRALCPPSLWDLMRRLDMAASPFLQTDGVTPLSCCPIAFRDILYATSHALQSLFTSRRRRVRDGAAPSLSNRNNQSQTQ